MRGSPGTREGVAKALPRVMRQIVSTLTPASGLKEAGMGFGVGSYDKKNKAHTMPEKARACYPELTMHSDL